MEDIRKELKRTRIFCAVSSVVTLCLLAAILFLIVEIQPVLSFAEKAGPVVERLSQLDIDALNGTLEQLDGSLGQVNWEELGKSLEQLDVEEINEAIRNLDTEELTTALENLNRAVDTLEAFGERLRTLFLRN